MDHNSDYLKLGDKLFNEISGGLLKEELFWQISSFYSDDEEHAKRLFSYFQKKYFCASTPVLAGTPKSGEKLKNLPISCFISEVCDNDVEKTLIETISLSKAGGGIGTLWDNFPSIYDRTENERNSFGVLPFVQLQGKTTRLTAGFARKIGSLAVFLNVRHADIVNFIRMRKNAQGIDTECAIPRYIHHAIVIPDEFMNCVVKNQDWFLYDKQGHIVNKVKARELFVEVLSVRTETGEPYLVFEDNINQGLAAHHKKLGLKIKSSNLCTEIALITGKDHKNINRTAVCCLSSINLEKYEEWRLLPQFFEDIARFMDNVLTFFIVEAPKKRIGQVVYFDKEFGITKDLRAEEEKAVNDAFTFNSPFASTVYSAKRSRDIGVGAAGWSAFLQKKGIPFESEEAHKINKEIFSLIKEKFDNASKVLAHERGPCEDAAECGIMERFSYKTAIAPTTQIAPLMGTSKCIEIEEPVFLVKNQVGFNLIKNPLLEEYLEQRGLNFNDTWTKIASQGLQSVVNKEMYEVFKGPYDVNPLAMVQQVADRPIDQAQSFTIFFHTPIDMHLLLKTHLDAWKLGVKTMYYCRTTSKISASYSIISEIKEKLDLKECIMCQ